MTSTCDECGGKVVSKAVDYSLLGISLGKFTAQECAKCGEQLFSLEESEKITRASKAKGLWGLHSQTKVGKVGNSMDIKIAKNIADFMGLNPGKEVFVRPESKKRLIIEISP